MYKQAAAANPDAPVAAAAAPQPAAAVAAAAVAAATQQKAVVQAKQMTKKATGAWWKNPHFGFKKGAHMKKGKFYKKQMPIFDPKAAGKSKDMAYFKKVGLA